MTAYLKRWKIHEYWGKPFFYCLIRLTSCEYFYYIPVLACAKSLRKTFFLWYYVYIINEYIIVLRYVWGCMLLTDNNEFIIYSDYD